MGRNRTLGSPLTYQVQDVDFTTEFIFDAYYVTATPRTVTLDPNAVAGDQVLIQDVSGTASLGTPITVLPSPDQTAEAISIGFPLSGVILTLVVADGVSTWVPEYFQGASVPPAGGGIQINHVPIPGGPFAEFDIVGVGITGSNPAPGLAQINIPTGGFPNRETATANSFAVPVFAPLPGVPTATLVNGSPNVTMSAPVTLSKGDLLFFTGATPIPPYEVAAAVVASAALTLTAPYGGASGAGVATATIPVADAVLVPAVVSGLSAAGYTINYSGQVAVDNTNGGTRGLVIYVAGASQYESGFVFYQDLDTQNQNLNIPFDVDIVVGGPAPTTFQPRVFLYCINGASGDVIAATIGNSFGVATQVA